MSETSERPIRKTACRVRSTDLCNCLVSLMGSSMASPLAGTAQEGGSMTCELKTTLSSDTLRARDDAAIAITSSVLREVANDSCGGRFNRDR